MTTSSTTPQPAPDQTPATPAKAAAKTAAKAAATTVKKAPARPAASKQAAAKTAAPAAPQPAKDSKAKKPKLVRDSFTIPKDEYAVIETLKQRAAALAQPVKKSELLRAGLKVLAAMSDSALRSAVQAVPSIKTGRPKADDAAAPRAKPAAKGAQVI